MAKDRIPAGLEGCFSNDIRRIVDRNLTDISLCTTQTDVTSSTTLVNVTGMATDGISLAPGTYKFDVRLAGTSGASGGWKLAFKQNNGLTLTSIEATARGTTASAIAVQHTTTATDAASLFAQTAAVIFCDITGTMVILTAGTIQLQFAQNASDGTACSIYVGSRMEFTRIGAQYTKLGE